ncbi:hypothetical protein HDV01_004417 [Terramyces sp. JEL0728]|nr:hypothetical protein HDV01_004417 [Terramyces sp. JEL0728]
MQSKIVIGTRESQLAMIQANQVKSELEKIYPDIEFSINGMTTTGDQILDKPLSQIGAKALFTKELEVALHDKIVDLVVHSLKDLPTTLPDGMTIGAVLERKDPRDAIIMSLKNKALKLKDLEKGSVIGTSSVRRIAQLKRKYPHLVFQDIVNLFNIQRGNLNTRLRKLDDENSPFTALLLAYAGVSRMGWEDRITEILEKDVMLHAVGQGAIGVECRLDDSKVLKLLGPLNHTETVLRTSAERSFMKTLEGGCSVPLGVATIIKKTGDAFELSLIGSVTSLDGSKQIKHDLNAVVHSVDDAVKLGVDVANELIKQGAEDILEKQETFALVSQQIVLNYRFDLAQQQAQGILQAFINEYNPKVSTKLSFPPTDHNVSGACEYEPGYLVNDPEAVEADIAKFKGIGYDTLKIRKIKAGSWAVYRYSGGFEGLGRAWETAKAELEKFGKKRNFGEGSMAFELYLNNLGETASVEPITEIWIPVE